MVSKSFLGHSSKRNFSRRGLFRASFAGLSAAAFLGSANAQETSARPEIDEATTAETTFRHPLVDGTGGFANTFGCFLNGWCVIAAGSTLYSTVQCVDIQSGNPNPHEPYWFTTDSKGQKLPTLGTMVGVDGFAVAPGADGKFYVVNVNNVALAEQALAPVSITPPAATSALTTYGDSIVYLSTDGYLNAITISAPPRGDVTYSQVWRVPLNLGRPPEDSGLVVSGSHIVVNWGLYLLIFDISGQTPQLVSEPRYVGERMVGLDVDDSMVYVTLLNGVLAYSLDPTVSASPWKSRYYASNPGETRCCNAIVYFADDSGKFIALDGLTGQRLWSLDLVGGAGNRTPIVIEDGIAYVTTTSTINAIDLISRTNLTYNGGTVELVGVENGIAFVVEGSNKEVSLVGVDLGLQVHGFASESKLLADSVVSSTNAQPANPVFRTVVQLVDHNKNPRAFISVKLWASDAVTIDAEGSTITLSGSSNGAAGASFLWLTTDGSGTIYLASQAVDVSSPAIYLWASFMDTEEAMVLYPDQQAANDLATVNAASFSTKATFDGSKLLADGVDPDAAAKSLLGVMAGNGADAVATLSRTRARLRQRASQRVEQLQLAAVTPQGRRRMLTVQDEDSYIAYPDSTTNLLYQQFAGPTDRSFDTAKIQPFQLTFDPKTGDLIFYSGTFVLPQQITGLSLKDFVKRVIHGAERVTKAICSKIGDAVSHFITTIVDGIEYAYSITVGALEDAVHVAVGVLKSIVKDVQHALQKAIEWLSFVFSWDAIKATKEDIYNRVFGDGSYPGFVSQLRSWEQNCASKGIEELQGFIDKASQQILDALEGVNDHFQNSSLQSQQLDGNDPKSMYNMNGADGYTPSSMITAKLNANVDNAQELPSASALTSASTLIDLAEKVFDDAKNALEPRLECLKQSFDQFVASFRLLITDPGAFIGTAFSKLTAIFAEVAVVLLQAVSAVVGSLIGNLADMVESIVTSLLAPIHIPVVSTIWNAIFGSAMSYLDLACWMTAIPTSITTRAASSSVSAVQSVPFLAIAQLYATFPAAILDALNDAKGTEGGTLLRGIQLACAFIPLALSIPFDFSTNNDPLYFFFAILSIPWVINAISLAVTKFGGKTPFVKTWPTVSTFMIVSSGLAAIEFNIYAAFFAKSVQFIGPKHLRFCQNLFASLTDVCKFGLFSTGQVRIGVAITDVVFPITASSLGVAAAALG